MCCDDGWHWVSVSVRGDKKSNYECRGGTREWWGSKDSEKRIGPDPSNDKGNQSIWERFGRWKVLFPPSAVWSQGSVRGQEYDP